MNVRMLSLSSLLLVTGLVNGGEEKNTSVQELLQYVETQCQQVNKEEVQILIEHLKSNPDLKHEHSNLIENIVTSTQDKATMFSNIVEKEKLLYTLCDSFKQPSQKDAVKISLQEHKTCALNCAFAHREFKKLTEKK